MTPKDRLNERIIAMSREIKFRAFMVEDNLMETSQGLVASLIGDHGDGTVYHVMQYTGLKDRHGVEIYEGDIVNMSDYWIHAEVIRSELGTLATFMDDGMCDEWTVDEWKNCEVIGNIYETPELLTPPIQKRRRLKVNLKGDV